MDVHPTGVAGVYVRELSTRDLFDLKKIKRRREDEDEDDANSRFAVALIRLCAVKEDGTPFYAADDEVLDRMSLRKFVTDGAKIVEAALQFNGLSDGEDDEGNA